MSWVLKTLELQPEEEEIGQAWVEKRPFVEFFQWVSDVLAYAAEFKGVAAKQRVLGKILEFAGQQLREQAEEAELDDPDAWDGREPQPPR